MTVVGLLADILTSGLGAQDAPIPPEIEDLQVTDINKEAAHAILMPYATQSQALAGKRRASPWARDLNGPWRFNWVKTPQESPADFHKPNFDVSHWKTIPVPSNWEVGGYGTPIYRNFGYIFKVDPPHVMSEPPQRYTCRWQERYRMRPRRGGGFSEREFSGPVTGDTLASEPNGSPPATANQRGLRRRSNPRDSLRECEESCSQAARRSSRWCRPPTWGSATILPSSGPCTGRGSGASWSRPTWVRLRW